MVLQGKCQPTDMAAGAFLDKEQRAEQALNLAVGSVWRIKRGYFELTNKVCYILLI